jgi:hypothetical protein
MILLNALWVGCLNSFFGRVIGFREPPAEAIYSLGYGYDYGKTDN